MLQVFPTNQKVDYVVRKSDHFYRDETIQEKEMIVVGGLNYYKWAHFKCPCGCGEIINLSLMRGHRPSWTLKVSLKFRPSLYPSVWKKEGCGSHFWVKDGMVIWHEGDW